MDSRFPSWPPRLNQSCTAADQINQRRDLCRTPYRKLTMIPVKKQGGQRHFRSTLFDSSGALDKQCFSVLLWTHSKSAQDKEVVMLNIVFVECNTLGDDLDWTRFSDLGHVSFLNSPPIDEIPDLVHAFSSPGVFRQLQPLIIIDNSVA